MADWAYLAAVYGVDPAALARLVAGTQAHAAALGLRISDEELVALLERSRAAARATGGTWIDAWGPAFAAWQAKQRGAKKD